MESEAVRKARGERVQLARYISSKMKPDALLQGDHVVTYVFDDDEANQRKQRIQYVSFNQTPFQTLGVFPHDGGITEDSYKWKREMKMVVMDRLDAFPLAFADPRFLRVPVIATKNLWAEVIMFSADDKNQRYDFDDRLLRAQTHVREVHVISPKRSAVLGTERQADYAGTLEYPFSMLDVRSLVVAYMDANFDNEDLFFTECLRVSHDPEMQVINFGYRYKVATEGVCPRCDELDEDFSAAIPSVK